MALPVGLNSVYSILPEVMFINSVRSNRPAFYKANYIEFKYPMCKSLDLV